MLRLVNWTIETKSLLFYEGGVDTPYEEERLYHTRFFPNRTRFIYGEIELSYSLLTNNRLVQLEYVYYSPDGTIFDQNTMDIELPAGTDSYSHSFRNGILKYTPWLPGEYKVAVFYDGNEIAVNSFEMIRRVDSAFNEMTVDSFLLFESDLEELPKPIERLYLSKFMQVQTRAIYCEVYVSYPKLRKDTHAIIDQIYYDPDGNEFGRNQLEFIAEKETTCLTFEMGLGYDTGGRWLCGLYRIELFLNGSYLGEKEFEIITLNVALLPALIFDSLKFFQSGYVIDENEKRVYQTKFSKETTCYVYWELSFSFPLIHKKRKIEVEFVYLKQDQTVFGYDKSPFYLERGWENACLFNSWGFFDPGRWETGIYTAIITINGKKFCEAQFEIVE
ncbi:hypothetical protein DRW41_05670 [Neobacillus piezotolerans]|uniref:Uncharacterized protein n=1 Tax=Neobacillus piezotolerans TaxID=2259171 RepID=A0A3D8GTE9_9BACI|nr:hypothetical protein [Neobacillus piezotolerans]RDU37336.1 hypothetical protein DRW41_05670 [Neobacillus piezotolerans]